ncbi:MAG: hypothetical protein HC894_16130 [Microcoleus sp. SM1_3_4]|nr:hypothetical protein [Microcoleus sp. SM1_3_4]
MKKEEGRRKKEEVRERFSASPHSPNPPTLPIPQSANLPICQSHNLPIAQSKI